MSSIAPKLLLTALLGQVTAQESITPKILIALVSALPVLLSPLVVWVLGRSNASGEAARVEYLSKRLDLIERLNKMRSDITDEQLTVILSRELSHCETFLAHRPPFVVPLTVSETAKKQSWLGRFFLTAPSKNIRQRVFKGLFYFFLMIFALGLLAAPVLFAKQGSDAYTGLIGVTLYLLLALGCRALAKPPAA
jgi:hypothetical protein